MAETAAKSLQCFTSRLLGIPHRASPRQRMPLCCGSTGQGHQRVQLTVYEMGILLFIALQLVAVYAAPIQQTEAGAPMAIPVDPRASSTSYL